MNQYREMHRFALSGGKRPPKKLWTLYYGDKAVISNVAYPICVQRMKELKATGNYKLQTFKIK